jgi:hypothetical protein
LAVMKTFIPVFSGFLLLLPLSPAQGQVLQCKKNDTVAFSDGRLQSAIEALKLKFPGLDFQTDEPCKHAKTTTTALARTLRHDYLKNITGFEYVKILNGDWYFTVERFKVRKANDQAKLETALKKCQHCKLAIEENTCLAHFVSGDNVVFMISSATGCKDNSEKFQQIQQSFPSLEKPQAASKIDISAVFDPRQPTPLCKLMKDLGSDKGSTINGEMPNYTTYYYAILSPLREQPLRIFEMGIGSNDTMVPSNMGPDGRPGASLRGWKAFFPKAQVFGADIDRKALFSEERIQTFYCDMTKPEQISAMWKEPALARSLDIIVEDGLHVFEAQVTFFENAVQKLTKGGVYIMEDVAAKDIPRFEARMGEWQTRFAALDLSFRIVRIPHPYNRTDNNLLVAQRNR